MQMVRSSVPSANQVACRILPMVAVFVKAECTVGIDCYVFKHLEQPPINQIGAYPYLSTKLSNCRVDRPVVAYR